jgi:DNA-binding MarR family transcriptional regulator
MRVFERMRALRAFENQHLLFLKTDGQQHLIGEIGHHQAAGKPLTLKQLFLLDIGSIATVQRHLRRLKELGLVEHRRSTRDRRSVDLTLTQKCIRIFAKYDSLMTVKPPVRGSGGKPRHQCGLCDGDAAVRKLLVTFLLQGLKQGDRCVLVAPAAAQDGILAELRHRRKAPAGLIVSEGYESVDAQVAFFKREFRQAKLAGRAMRLATDMTWTLSKSLRIDAIREIEMRFDALAGRLPLTGLCVYDARRFSSGDILRAAKCHRDHARYPIVLG